MKTKEEEQQIIIDSIPSRPHGLLLIAPRVGKTKIAISLIKRDKIKKVLWVTPSTKLRDVDLPEEFKKWKALKQLKSVTFICYSSLAKHVGKYDYIILDEYQSITEANWEPIFKGRIGYKNILGLSGTHPKDPIKQALLEILKLPIIYKMNIEKAINKNLISDYTIRVVNCSLNNVDKDIKAGNKVTTWYQTEKEAYSYLCKIVHQSFGGIRRMRFIYDSKTKEDTAKKLIAKLSGRKLVFCSSIAQSERLGKDKVYHSKTSKDMLNNFLEYEIDELYCVKAGGVGFTFKGIDHLVLIQTDSDKKGDTTQRISRALLSQEGYIGNIWIICLEDTKDKEWLQEALKEFDKDKIKYYTLNQILDGNK